MIKWNPDKQLAQRKIATTIDAVTFPVTAGGQISLLFLFSYRALQPVLHMYHNAFEFIIRGVGTKRVGERDKGCQLSFTLLI